MARKAIAVRSGGMWAEWAKSHEDELKVGAFAAAVAFFFTQGLPLWNEDYSVWLGQAGNGFFSNLLRLISPVTSEPQTWGFSDRPGQVLIYQLLSLFFGTWGTGYYLVKAAIFGGLVGVLYRWMRRLGIDTLVAGCVLALFVLSTNTMASIIWHSDFGAYAQLLLAFTLFWALPQVEKGPSGFQVYRRGLAGIPKPFLRFSLTFFALVYFGTKVRADVRLAPLVLLTYLYLFRREKFFSHLPPLGLTFLATLPWSGQLFRGLPPFLPGAKAASGGFSSFNAGRVIEFFAADGLRLKTAPLSVLGGLGIALVLALVVYGAYRLYQERLEAPDSKWGFFLVWFAFALLACGILTTSGANHPLRFTLIPLVPAVFLAGLSLQAAFREFGKMEWFRYAAYAVVALQCGVHGYHDFQFRRDTGRNITAVDQIHAAVERNHGSSTFVYGPGFAGYGYKTGAGAALEGRKNLSNLDEVGQLPAGNTYVAAWGMPLDSRFTLDLSATGCGSALFDRLMPCPTGNGAVLARYVGVPQELTQADQLASQGNLAGARQLLETYLQREPGNLGMAFVLSLYAYRQTDYARMEQLYDRIGPFYSGHPAVAYNWGLAKQGVQKFGEAARHLERAYSMVPKDYSIGFNLADSYQRQGKRSRALATLDDLLKAYPDNVPLKDAYSRWSK